MYFIKLLIKTSLASTKIIILCTWADLSFIDCLLDGSGDEDFMPGTACFNQNANYLLTQKGGSNVPNLQHDNGFSHSPTTLWSNSSR
jgi:hypothetical protein